MGCIVIGTGIIDCDHDPEEGGLRQRLHDSLQFQQSMSPAGSIYNRSVSNTMNLRQSDYLTESLTDVISFMHVVIAVRDLPISLSDNMVLSDLSTVSGGRVDAPPPNINVSAIFDSTAQKGMVVYVSSSGHVDLAQADAESTSLVVGLANELVIAAAIGDYLTDNQVSRSDWTPVTGSTTLVAGATYYLSATVAGQLSTSPPTGDGDSVVGVGTALTTTTLDIEVAQSVLL